MPTLDAEIDTLPDAELDQGGGAGAVTPSAPVPVRMTLTGSVFLWDGTPAAGAVLYLGAQIEVRPLREGIQGGLDPTPYPPFTPPDGVTEPTPVPLFGSPPHSLSVLQTGGGVPLRRVPADAEGAFSCVLPTPQALAYSAGARTDADMDPTRGGAYSVAYVAVMPDGRLVVFSVDTATLAGDGSLDITTLLATAPL